MKRYLAFFCSIAVILSVTGCKKQSEAATEAVAEVPVTDAPEPEKADMSVYWLADYDLNPDIGKERSTALALFEDVYGGSINLIYAETGDKWDKLIETVNAGERVDMFPYDPTVFPYGTLNNPELFQPFDSYYGSLEMDDPMWDGMKNIIENFKYKGQHYVIPYDTENPLFLTYSKKAVEELKLEDPYKLFTDNKWDWDTFNEYADGFKASGKNRYAIAGLVGEGFLSSVNVPVVGYDGNDFINNLSNPSFEKVQNFLKGLSDRKCINPKWENYYPTDGNTLFYAMQDWALYESNAKNPGIELGVVPFPNEPNSGASNNVAVDYKAMMLVGNSSAQEAVATYVKCERLVASNGKYEGIRKKNAFEKRFDVTGAVKGYLTETQYDLLQTFRNSAGKSGVDFAYGMGPAVYTAIKDRVNWGVINGLTEDFKKSGFNWEDKYSQWNDTINAEAAKYNTINKN